MKLLWVSVMAWGLTLSSVVAQDVSVINMAMTALNEAGQPPQACGGAQVASCSFTQVCSDLSSRRNSPYLYENAAGERIPNFNYQDIASRLMQCGRQSGLYFQASQTTEVHPLEFNRWLIQQPADVQLNFNRVELSFADAAYAQTASPRLQGESESVYITRQFTEAASREVVEMSEGLVEAIRRKVEHEAALGSQQRNPAIDWQQVPPRIREVLQDPFLNPEMLSQEGALGLSARAQFSLRTVQITALANEVRQQTLRVMQDQQARYPERAASIEAMSVRLRTARIDFVNDPIELKNFCPSPNAFYDPTTHTLKICPQMMGMPTEHLRMVIAHELGHSVDPCNAACPLHVVQAGFETQYSVADASSVVAVIPGVFSGVAATGSTYPENPFREVLSCLRNPESLNAQVADPARARVLLEEQIRIQRASGEDASQAEQMLASINRLVTDFAGCSILPGKSRQQEAFADWLAAEAAALAPGPTNLTEVGGMFYALECPGLIPDLWAEAMPALMENNCLMAGEGGGIEAFLPEVYQTGLYLGSLEQQQADSHPPTVDRINNLFRLQPRLREQMGCSEQPAAGTYCAP